MIQNEKSEKLLQRSLRRLFCRSPQAAPKPTRFSLQSLTGAIP